MSEQHIIAWHISLSDTPTSFQSAYATSDSFSGVTLPPWEGTSVANLELLYFSQPEHAVKYARALLEATPLPRCSPTLLQVGYRLELRARAPVLSVHGPHHGVLYVSRHVDYEVRTAYNPMDHTKPYGYDWPDAAWSPQSPWEHSKVVRDEVVVRKRTLRIVTGTSD